MAAQTIIVVTKEVGNVVQVTDRFSKLEFTGFEVRADGKSNILKFQAVNQMADSMVGVGAGSTLQVTFEIEGREWTKDDKTNVFMNLNVISFKILTPSKEPEINRSIKAKDIDTSEMFPDDDDLPF